jgi:hypothetical protein
MKMEFVEDLLQRSVVTEKELLAYTIWEALDIAED